jgi:hypothetical protein
MNRQNTALLLMCLVAPQVFAQTFSTTVNVVKNTTQIAVIQQSEMVLPKLKIDKNAQNGTVMCSTSGRSGVGSVNCRGKRKNGVYVISGQPNTDFSVQLSTTAISKNGLRINLSIAGQQGSSFKGVLGRNGTYRLEVVGELVLEDKTLVNTAQQIVDFDLTAVYN